MLQVHRLPPETLTLLLRVVSVNAIPLFVMLAESSTRAIRSCPKSHHTLTTVSRLQGGASIFFAKRPVQQSVLNDLDTDLMNTFRQIRDRVDDLIDLLDGVPATKKLHSFYKNEYSPTNDLERAYRWFYLNRTSYSGIMRHENCYWGYGPKYSMRPEKLAKAVAEGFGKTSRRGTVVRRF